MGSKHSFSGSVRVHKSRGAKMETLWEHPILGASFLSNNVAFSFCLKQRATFMLYDSL